MRAGPLGLRAVLLLTLCAPLLGGANCEHVENPGTDDAFIRAPGQKPAEIEMPKGALLPMLTGARWVMLTQTVTANGDKTQKPKQGMEIITVLGPQQVEGKSGVAMEFRQGPKTAREEVYLSNDKEVALISAGFADKMSISPPMPLYRFPLKEGDVVQWNGILRFKGKSAPGSAYSRLSGRDKIKTAAGEFATWRVDTVISTNVDGQPITLLSNRWLSPGIGMVKQRWYYGKQMILKELREYKVGDKVGGVGNDGKPSKN
jgi:hypothetical protein